MAKQTKAQKALARVSDYQRIFESQMGQRVLWDLMHQHGILSSTFDPDTHEMARKEGERNVVLRIMLMLNVDVKLLHSKMREAANAAETDSL